MGRVDAILFDIYNTLLANETDEERQDAYAFLSLWLGYHGVHINPVELHALYLDLCRKEIGRSAESYPDIDIGEVFARILSNGGTAAPPPGVVAEMALLFRMWTSYRLSPFPGVVPLLETLKGRAKLGIVSNAQRLFTVPELTRFGMLNFFDVIVLSSDLGVSKPDRKIFRKALTDLAVPPERSVYVGDNLLTDISGAQSVGMKGIWINRGGVDPDPRVVADFVVRDESALTEVLLSML